MTAKEATIWTKEENRKMNEVNNNFLKYLGYSLTHSELSLRIRRASIYRSHFYPHSSSL